MDIFDVIDSILNTEAKARRIAAGIPANAAGPWDEPLALAAKARTVATQYRALADR